MHAQHGRIKTAAAIAWSVAIALFGVAAFANVNATANGDKADKITICHRTDSN